MIIMLSTIHDGEIEIYLTLRKHHLELQTIAEAVKTGLGMLTSHVIMFGLKSQFCI